MFLEKKLTFKSVLFRNKNFSSKSCFLKMHLKHKVCALYVVFVCGIFIQNLLFQNNFFSESFFLKNFFSSKSRFLEINFSLKPDAS